VGIIYHFVCIGPALITQYVSGVTPKKIDGQDQKKPGQPTPELNQISIVGHHPSRQRVLREPGVRGFHPRPLRWLRLRFASGFRDFGQFPGGFAARRQGRAGCEYRFRESCIRRAVTRGIPVQNRPPGFF
jgi:hypothetical protein